MILIARTLVCCYDEYVAIQFVLNTLEGRMTAFECKGVEYFVVDKAIHIIQRDKTICISLKTVRGAHAQSSIVESFFFYTDMIKFLN